MAIKFKSRAHRSRRFLTIVKPSGSLHPRVQKVGPERFFPPECGIDGYDNRTQFVVTFLRKPDAILGLRPLVVLLIGYARRVVLIAAG